MTYYTPHSFSAPSSKLSTSISPRSLPPPYARYPRPLPAPPPPPSRMRSTSSEPRMAATAVLRRGARTALAPPPPILPLPLVLALKTVLRRLWLLLEVKGEGSGWEAAGLGGGGTEKRARSCDSVSRIRVVISCWWSRAFVNILGGGKLRGLRQLDG